jgi:hypothetical protein
MRFTTHEYKKGKWYVWFAWRPVNIYEDDYSHLVWLEYVEREPAAYGYWNYRLIKDD